MASYLDAETMKIYSGIGIEEKKLPEYVYYYCSLDSFLKIISNSTFRLSNLEKSNDAKEVSYFCSELYNIIVSELYDYNKTAEKPIKEDSIKAVMHTTRICAGHYGCCFTENADNIHMWREYGDRGRGVAIKLKLKELFNLYNENSKLKVGKVAYGVKHVATQFKEKFNNIITTSAKDDLCESVNNFVYKFITNNIGFAAFFKTKEHSYEHEWRLLYNPLGNVKRTRLQNALDLIVDAGIYTDETKLLKFAVSSSGRFLTSYFDYDFTKIRTSLISEIMLGNKCEISEDDMELLLLLVSKGYQISKDSRSFTVRISRSKMAIM